MFVTTALRFYLRREEDADVLRRGMPVCDHVCAVSSNSTWSGWGMSRAYDGGMQAPPAPYNDWDRQGRQEAPLLSRQLEPGLMQDDRCRA